MELTYNTLEDLPVLNWFKCNKTQDYKHLLKVYDAEYEEDLTELYETLHQEYLDLFGAGDEREKVMSLIKRLIVHKADYLLGKKYVINYIKSIEYQLSQLDKTQPPAKSIHYLCAELSKAQGYRIDPKDTSVVEFHEIINLIQSINNGTTTD